MNNLNMIKTAAIGSAMTVSLICGSAGSAYAQCVAGLGSTLSQLSTQKFPSRLSTDYSSLPTLDGQQVTFGHLTHLATDGGNLYVVDSANKVSWQISPASSSSGPTVVSAAQGPSLGWITADTRLISAGGIVWASNPSQPSTLVALGYGSLSAPGSSGAASPNWTGKVQVPDSPTSGTFDGTNVWIATLHGTMIKLSPAIRNPKSSDGWNPPAVAGSYPVANGALDNAVFDGRYIWATFNDTRGEFLMRFDPQNGAVEKFAMPATVSSLNYDGTFFWIGTSGTIFQFDPVAGAIKSQWNSTGTNVLFNGSTVDVFGKGIYTSYRACDMAQANQGTLPGTASSAVMLNGQYWVTYGSNTLSVR